ncbi:MAG: hypothetical protein JJ992_01300, partial [Planctomycetes bacterium]|nr:hypothetical protein [Planctomycetota bacterium]
LPHFARQSAKSVMIGTVVGRGDSKGVQHDELADRYARRRIDRSRPGDVPAPVQIGHLSRNANGRDRLVNDP